MPTAELSAAQTTTMEFNSIEAGPSMGNATQEVTPSRSRSKACLHCRRRKMRCDGAKPACFQCKRADRASECEYDDGTTKTVTQLLYEKLHRLEKRLRELQAQKPNHAAGRSGASSHRRHGPSGQHRASSSYMPGHGRTHSGSVSSRPTSSAGSSSSFHEPAHITSASGSFAQVPSMAFRERLPQSDVGHGQDFFPVPSQFRPNSPFVYPSQQSNVVGQDSSQSPLFAYDYGSFNSQPHSHMEGYDWATRQSYDSIPHDMNQISSPDASPVSHGCEDLSPALFQYLIDRFVPHAQQVGFTPRAPFLASSYPPALLSVILLWGVHFAPDKSLSDYREPLLRRAIAALPELLHQQDGSSVYNLLAAIQASTLLATYFFSQGRPIEGAYHSNTATGLILCTGLRTTRLTPSRSHPSSPLHNSIVPGELMDSPIGEGSGLDLLPTPRSKEESVERLCTFWNAFVMERTWAAACGLPAPGWRSSPTPSFKGVGFNGSGPDERSTITASWPAEYNDDGHRRSYSPPNQIPVGQRHYSPPLAQSAHVAATVEDFLVGIDPSPTNSTMELRAKAAALFEAASRLADEPEPDSSGSVCPYTPQLAGLQRTISIFIKRLPSVYMTGEHGFSRPSSFESCSIFVTNSMAQASVIRAHYSLAERAYDTTMSCSVRPRTNDIIEKLYAYERVHSQYGIDSVGTGVQGGGSRSRTPAVSENAALSMAVAALDKCLLAAKEIVGIIGQLTQEDYTFLEPVVGSCWMLAALVLLREVDRIGARHASSNGPYVSSNRMNDKFDLISKVNIIVGALQSLGRVFPIAETQAHKIISMLAPHTRQA